MNNFPEEIKETFSKLALSGKSVGDEPYIVGGFIRDWLMNHPIEKIKDIDIISRYGKTEEIIYDFVTRYGLGEPKLYDYTGTQTIFFKNYKLEFQSSDNPNVHFPIEEELEKMGIENSFLNKNIYERDFTINTICYDVINNKIIDLTGYGIDDLINKTLRTPINAEAAIFFNPLIILRGLRFLIEFNLKFDPEYHQAMLAGLELLPKAVEDRDTRFVNSIIRETFSHNEKKADELYRKYGIYDLIDMPKDLMDKKIKSDMGIKYIAKYDTLYKVSEAENKVKIVMDIEDVFENENMENLQKLAAHLYINNIISNNTEFVLASSEEKLFSIENIKETLANFKNNKIVAIAQSGNFLYERYRRRKEYRDRKRREDKRDRINKLKTWHDLQNKLR